MKINFNLTTFLFAFFCFFLTTGCKEDFYVPVTVKVVDSMTKKPIYNARLVYNASEIDSTDFYGEVKFKYNLKHFLADSISLYATKDDYKDKNYSNIVGNTQRDIFLIELEPK